MNLDAWEPPDPPDVADAVIARMHASTPHADEAPRRRYLWALLALPVAAAVATYVATRGSDADTDGAITADRARHVDLGGASADLEPKTTIRWHRDRTGLRVEQIGTATWKTDDHLRIAAGATSIDATAANLRVETQMNRQDAATVATSAITAAAVALVTVTVYNGNVRANNAPVAAGATIVVPAPTIVPDCDAAALQARGEKLMQEHDYEGGEKAFLEAMECKPDAQHMVGAYLAACKLKDAAHARQWYARLPQAERDNPSTLQTCLAYDVDPRTTVGAPPPNNAHQAALDACNDASNRRAWDKLPACAADLAKLGDGDTAKLFVQRGEFESANAKIFAEYEQAFAAHDGNKVRALIARMPASSVYAGQMVPLAICDVDDLKRRGEELLSHGDYATALQIFSSAYDCRPEVQTALRAYLASCKNQDVTDASIWFHRLPAGQQTNQSILQICINGGIDPRPEVTATDNAVVKLTSAPSGASILVDGRDYHLRTPATIRVAPGKHKVSLVTGDDKYTWTVTAIAGQTVEFSKKLR